MREIPTSLPTSFRPDDLLLVQLLGSGIFAPALSFADKVRASGAQAHFRLGEENTGSPTLIDALGNWNTGTWSRGTGVTHDAAGFVDDGSKSSRFNGTGYADTQATTQLGDGLYAGPGRAWSFMAYFRVTAGATGTLVARAGATLNNRQLTLYFNGGQDTPSLYLRGNKTTLAAGLDDGQSHCIALTWDGNQVKVFVDGKFFCNTFPGTATEEASQRIILGGRTNGTSTLLNGDMGEVPIWTRELKGEEVWDLAQRPPSSNPIYIIGSSTAGGTGASPGNGWASLLSKSSSDIVVNRALGGTIISNALPTGGTKPSGWSGSINPVRNVSYALSNGAKMLIIGYASNEAAETNGTTANYMACVAQIIAAVQGAGCDFRIFTTQPRNYPELSRREMLRDTAAALVAEYGEKCVNVYTELADPATLNIKAGYDSGDGTHLTNSGHAYLHGQLMASF